MVHHDGTEHNVERLIGKVKMLDHSNLKFDRQVVSSRLGASAVDLLFPWVNTKDVTRGADARLHFHCQRSSATTYIQYILSRLNAGEVRGSLAQLPQFAAKQEGVEEPLHQVITPTRVKNQPSGLFHGPLAWFAVAVFCKRMHFAILSLYHLYNIEAYEAHTKCFV